jgi:hypothetical protein
LNGSNVVFGIAVKIKWFAGAAVIIAILSPEWIGDVGDMSTIVGVFYVSTS